MGQPMGLTRANAELTLPQVIVAIRQKEKRTRTQKYERKDRNGRKCKPREHF